MSQLTGNSCNIITILPMGLDCDSIDASTPDSTNGFVVLYITGGTPPYTVTWNNGQQGTFLTNLGPGSYTATVVDYYGDFTATTTCTVGFQSFYLEEFENCKDSSKVYYLADLPSTYEVGKIYELTTQAGCWLSSGITLYNTQTYIGSFAQVESGPYDECDECDPPIPPIVYPPKLCFTYGDGDASTSTEVNSGNTINGYPSWTASTPPNTVVYYNSATTRWEISGWTQSGVPVFNSPLIPPVGTWSVLGTYGKTLIFNEGICPPPPLSMRVSKNPSTCSTTNDGSVVIIPIGGTAPYTYSINGINYQSSNIFTNLIASTYTFYVKDANNSITSQSTTLNSQQTFQNYTINLTTISQNTVTASETETRTYTFKIEVTPQLPATKTLSFVLPVNILMTGNTTTTYTPSISTTQTSTLTFTTNGTATMTGPTSTSSITTNTTPKPLPCLYTNIDTSAYTQNYQGTITGGGSIIGTLVQQLTIPTVNVGTYNCALNASIKNVIGITNQVLTPSSCTNLNGAIQPLNYQFNKTGLVFESLRLCVGYKYNGQSPLCQHESTALINNKPFFVLKDQTCNNNNPLFLYWNITSSRWEVRTELQGGTLLSYLNYPGQYPEGGLDQWQLISPYTLEMQFTSTDGIACQFESLEEYLKYAEAVGLTGQAGQEGQEFVAP